MTDKGVLAQLIELGKFDAAAFAEGQRMHPELTFFKVTFRPYKVENADKNREDGVHPTKTAELCGSAPGSESTTSTAGTSAFTGGAPGMGATHDLA